MIDGIKVATGTAAGRATSTTAVPACTETRRSPGSDGDNIAPFTIGLAAG